MFKALSVYAMGAPDRAAMADALATLQFAPCAPTQPLSVGFVPPRKGGELVEWVGHDGVALLKFEERKVPPEALRRRVDELAAAIEQESGRKPGAKRRRELKEEALLDLLPQAFPKETAVPVWFDAQAGRLCLGTTSSARADAALTALVKVLPNLALSPLATHESPAACMRAWLADGVAPEGFGIGREAELCSADAQGATVRYSKHGLDGQDVQQHLTEGKQVKKLAFNWRDRAEFVLTDTLQLTGIKLDAVDELPDDPFDSDVVLSTGTLRPLLNDLIAGLGGRV